MSQAVKIDEAPDDHFVRVESRSGLAAHKPLIHVHVAEVQQSLDDTPEYVDYTERPKSERVTMIRSLDGKGQWVSKEPKTLFEKVEALLVNTYVEILSTVIASVTVFHPNYFSLVILLVTYIVFIGIPVHVIKTQNNRLKIYDIASKVMFIVTVVIVFLKVFFVEESYGESVGVYLKDVTDEETGVVTTETDFFGTFLFEMISLASYAIIYYVTHLIKIRLLLQTQDEPLTFLGCRYFSSKRRWFKYLFVSITLIEILNMPDLLALPVLYTFLALMVFAIIRVTGRRNRSTFMDSNYFAVVGEKGIVNWAMNNENLFQKMLAWQKACMMLQLFEFTVTHISQVRESIIHGKTQDESHLSLILFLLRCVGHTEYQTAEPLPNYVIAYQMAMTILIIFFGQCSEKAYFQYFNDEAMFETEQDPLLVRASSRFASYISRRRGLNFEYLKAQLYGFLPVILNWFVRIAIAVFAYMYNSYVGFYHLVWVMASFVVPLKIFYTVSVVILFPVVLVEFSLVYVANIKTFNHARVYTHSFFDQFAFHPLNLTLEMSLMYAIVVLVGLMIPARLRFLSYSNRHKGSDMTKDMIVKNLKDKHSNVLWKFLFIIIINLHTPVLFLMLFMGNSNFNLFQLGFMFFFVVYGSSQWLYYRTSILLPLFISYFILSQYFWSLVYFKYDNYNNTRDFLYMIDGWEPPADINDFYWTRMPNLQLWGLLFVMHALHAISQQFPDKEQNQKYIEECDKHISEQFPTISKWMKRIWNFLFMLVLVTVLFLLARDLIRQKSNIINLIYLILFTITFGKMCSTSLAGDSFKRCIMFSRYIKVYSAVVLILLVTYHLMVFEFYNLAEWLERKRNERNFFVLNIEIFGFGIEESSTRVSVQLYTAYLIVGQILESSFQQSIKQQESRDLFDWQEALKTPVGVARAANFFRFDTLYLVYRFFTYWPVLDFFCTYFHVLNNGIIVYFSVTVSISLFFGIHLSLIVFFYCYSSYIMHHATKEKGQHEYDLQQATDLCRKYKKLSADIFLKLRQRLWMTQYAITLAFMFAGYFDEIIDTVQQHSDNDILVERLKTVQFYMYWTGVYQPSTKERRIEGLMPIHIMFLFILFEKQAQNWLHSRWGLNKTLITKFAHLEFYLKLDKKGKEWLPQAEEGQPPLPEISSQDIMPVSQDLNELPQLQGNRWLMEQFNTYMIYVWRSVKIQFIFKAALQSGIKRRFSKVEGRQLKDDQEELSSKLANDEHIDTMTLQELTLLEKELSKKLAIDLDLCSHFNKMKLVIEGEECVLYLPIKEIVLEQMKKWNLIDLERVPFLSYSIVSSHRRSIHRKLNMQFLNSVQDYNLQHGFDITERVKTQTQDYRIQHLRRELMKIVYRRYSYEMWGGLRLAFEQLSLMLLLFNVIIKCNIVSLIYLILVTNYLLRNSKQRAMRNMVYIIGTIFIIQYWVYLMNLTSQSSPTPFPEQPYPNEQFPQGKYLIPIMYKFEFGRVMQNAYWYSFGVEIYTVRTLWVDFITLVLVSIYLFYYRNPVLSTHAESFLWCRNCKVVGKEHVCSCQEDEQQLKYEQLEPKSAQELETEGQQKIDFCKNLDEYHKLMVLKYPSETEYQNNKERLRELLDSCPYYLIVEGAQVLIFTTIHIFTMIVILLMALCRRSLVSIGYVIALAPCLWESVKVLKQHENYVKCERDLKEKQADPEFQKYPENQQRDILKYISQKYEWSFIKRICVQLSIYSYIDFVTQVTFQVPYIPNYAVLEHFGLRKIYPPHNDSFDYSAFISGHYDAPKLNMQNLIMQILNCVIVCVISTQSELFKSKGFKAFITQPNYGLDLLMKLSELKKWAITYDYNNQKLTKILLIQKTEQQIFGTVERLRLNAELWRKSQQRAMLEEYCLKYGGMYIPPNPIPPPIEEQKSELTNQSEESLLKDDFNETNHQELENLRIEKLVTEQTATVTSKLLPFRATIYISLMKLGQSYIFFNRREDMERIKAEMECGQQNNGIDLIRIIRSDLLSLLKKFESEAGQSMKDWPKLNLEDLRQTHSYCKWSNIIPRQWAAIFRAIISNTALISYICMLMSLYTNAGLVALLYPFVVFGYALLEETRPGRYFWRCILAYSLSVLFLKYVINLNLIHSTLSDTNWPLIDGFVKFGLHHLETTKDLVWHMLPEMLIVMSILCHEIVEQFTGLFEKSESQIEDVPAAIVRIFKKSKSKKEDEPESKDKNQQSQEIRPGTEANLEQATSQKQVEHKPPQRAMSSEVQPLLTRASLYPPMMEKTTEENKLLQSETQEIKQRNKVRDHLVLKLKEIKSAEELVTMEFNAPVPATENDDNFQRQVSLASRESPLKSLNTVQVINQENRKKSFWNSAYMQRIFPKVQQQKPGTDYYLWQNIVQIYICYYLMNNFSIFSATGPYQEKNLFQGEMTVVLFYNIACIILERIFARTENRKRVEKFKQTTEAVKPHIKPEQLFMPVQHNDLTVRLVIQKLKFQHLAEQQHVEALSKLRYQQDCEIIESESLVTPQQKGKFILHWVNLILVHAYIFWYMPIQANITLYGEPNCSATPIYGCKDFRVNESLKTFYLLYLLFFFISARQISQGLPSFRRGSSTMYYEGGERDDTEEDIYNGLHQVFINFPLAVEMRCLLDFTFTKTAIDLWQTCELFQYNSDFFIAKTSTLSYNRKVLGAEVSKFSKICFGYICTTIMLSFILGPFLMFSTIGGMTLYNPVIYNDLQFWVQVNVTSTHSAGVGNETVVSTDTQVVPFKLYDNESPSIYDFDEAMFKKRHFDEWPETKFFEPAQLQLIVPTYFSDTTWIASDSTRAFLQKYACIANIQSISDEEVPEGCGIHKDVSNAQNVSIGFQLKTLFKRNGPSSAKDAFGLQQRNLNTDDPYDRVLLSQFSKMLSERCTDGQQKSYTMNITNFFFPKLLLGETTTVEPIYFNTRETAEQAKRNLLLTYQCKDQWAVGTGSYNSEEARSLEFTVFSQKIVTDFLQGYNIGSFYTGLVLLIGMYMRPIFIFNTNRAFIYETNYADPMLRLCESIHLSRARGDLKSEEENFRLLQEILRSPELLHSLTGSNLKGGEYAPSAEERKAHLIPKAYGSQPVP